MLNTQLERALSFIELTVTRRLDGLLRGSFPSARPGPGTDPDAAREYAVGDDVRRIDWAVTARTGIPHVRDPEAERELECWVVADPAARLGTGAQITSKRELLVAAVGAIALLNNGPGDSTGLIADKLRIPRGSGRAHALQMMRQVSEATSSRTIASDIERVLATAPQAGLLIVISDFLDPIEWASQLRVASTKMEVLVIHLIDTADQELPGSGPVLMSDAETGRTVSVTVNEATRSRYREAAAAHSNQVRHALESARARIITLRTDRNWVIDFARQLGVRQ